MREKMVASENAKRSVLSLKNVYTNFFLIGAWTLLAAALAYAGRRFLHADLYEIADFAANSLLIQDAKHLQLWTGHYSRVGFNHPGPFFLYVLAIGESILFDALHIVKSPLAGQLFAVAILNAGWLTALARLLLRIHGSLSAAALSWLIIVASVVYVDSGFLNGLWLPHLFLWPFAVYCLASMRIAAGQSDSLIILALSGGALFHGHIAFAAICPIIFGGALVLSWCKYRYGNARTWLLAHESKRERWRVFGPPLAVALLFLLPLVVESVQHFPGPVAKYIGFGSANSHNGFGEALQFVAQYWAFRALPLMAALLLLLFLSGCTAKKFSEPPASISALRAAAPVLIIATAAVFVYAVVGVDDATMQYLGLFYFSVPAITLAFGANYGLLGLRRAAQWIVVSIVAAVFLPFIYRQATTSPVYAAQYADLNIPVYFERLAALDARTLALDLDNHEDWENVWKTLLGIEAYAERHGRPALFCIARHWHVSFAEKTRCSAQQLDNSKRLIVSSAADAKRVFGDAQLTLGNIGFYAYRPLSEATYEHLPVAGNQTLFTASVLGDGWSISTEDFAWSEGRLAILSFEQDPSQPIATIAFDIGAFLPAAKSTQTVAVVANGMTLATWHFDQTENRKLRTLPIPTELQRASALTIELNINKPVSPKQAGISTDPRMLGVALYGMGFTR